MNGVQSQPEKFSLAPAAPCCDLTQAWPGEHRYDKNHNPSPGVVPGPRTSDTAGSRRLNLPQTKGWRLNPLGSSLWPSVSRQPGSGESLGCKQREYPGLRGLVLETQRPLPPSPSLSLPGHPPAKRENHRLAVLLLSVAGIAAQR